MERNLEAFMKNLTACGPGCWEWKGPVDSGSGYGRFRWGGFKTLAHRAAWATKNGPIPEGTIICHSCNNRLCVNPDHLYAGDHSDNADDIHNPRDEVLKVTYGNTAMSQYSTALTACLRSGDNELRSVSVRHIERIFTAHGGNLLRAARASGISHRTLCRWVESDPDLRARLARARSVHDSNVIAQTTAEHAKP